MRTNDDLIQAVNERNHSVVKLYLTDSQVDPNARNKEGTPALVLAASYADSYSVFYLLEAGANPNLTSVNNVSALVAASAKGYFKTVKLLVHFKADITQRSSNHYTPREIAEHFKHSEIAKFLEAKEQERKQSHHTTAESSLSVDRQEVGLRRRNVHQESQDDETNIANITPSNGV